MTRRSPLVSVILAGSAAGLMAAPTGMTSCFDSSAAPPQGYSHSSYNLEFFIDRTMEPAVGFTTEYNRFTAIKCDAPSPHAFTSIGWCETNNCDSSCPISMPSECADSTTFGVCAPTVKNICDSLQSSVTSCKDGSSKAGARSDAYDGIDVQKSPCDGDIHKETLDALKQYKSAYNDWAMAYNNASTTCKVGTGIRDYNQNLLSPVSGKLDTVEDAALAVCGEDDFDPEANLPSHPNLGASERNKAICDKMRGTLANLRKDAQTASAQIQCFGYKCSSQRDAEMDAFYFLQHKHSSYYELYDKYFLAAKEYNEKVANKKIAKQAAIAEYGLFNDALADNKAKFSKDSEVFDTFVSGAAEGNCGLTQCEIDAVCGNDIAQKTDEYATSKDGNCKQVEFDSAEICYEEIADKKAKAAAEAAKLAAEKEAAKRAAEEQAAAEKAAAEAAAKAAAEQAAAEKAAALAPAPAMDDPFTACQQACAAEHHCCNNDIHQGSNQKLSCLQACMVVRSGTPKSECLSYCYESKCSYHINGMGMDLCRTCDDVPAHAHDFGPDAKPAPYQCSATYGSSTDTCVAGCEAGESLSSGTTEQDAFTPPEYHVDVTAPNYESCNFLCTTEATATGEFEEENYQMCMQACSMVSGWCVDKCAANNDCCNTEFMHGSNGKLSCLQGCIYRILSDTETECRGTCSINSCTRETHMFTFDSCGVCNDVPAHKEYFVDNFKPQPYECSATYGADEQTCNRGCMAGQELIEEHAGDHGGDYESYDDHTHHGPNDDLYDDHHGHYDGHGYHGHYDHHNHPGHYDHHNHPGHYDPHNYPGHYDHHNHHGHYDPHNYPGHYDPHNYPGHYDPHNYPGHYDGHNHPGHYDGGYYYPGHYDDHMHHGDHNYYGNHMHYDEHYEMTQAHHDEMMDPHYHTCTWYCSSEATVDGVFHDEYYFECMHGCMEVTNECVQECAANNACCNNDFLQGSNGKLSCLQACIARFDSESETQCLGHCSNIACDHNFHGIHMHTCGICDDVPAHAHDFGPYAKPAPYQCSATYGSDEQTCKQGCKAGSKILDKYNGDNQDMYYDADPHGHAHAHEHAHAHGPPPRLGKPSSGLKALASFRNLVEHKRGAPKSSKFRLPVKAARHE